MGKSKESLNGRCSFRQLSGACEHFKTWKGWRTASTADQNNQCTAPNRSEGKCGVPIITNREALRHREKVKVS